MVVPAKEAMRIVRSLEVNFASGPSKTGSAFISPSRNKLITCAHVVTDERGNRANRITVKSPSGATYEAKVSAIDAPSDLATIETTESVEPSIANEDLPELGEYVVFAGLPQGVARSSVFPGIVSNVGVGLVSFPRCEVIQVAGMINNGNSGGPLLDANGAVLGIISAKYVPLPREIDCCAKPVTRSCDISGLLS